MKQDIINSLIVTRVGFKVSLDSSNDLIVDKRDFIH